MLGMLSTREKKETKVFNFEQGFLFIQMEIIWQMAMILLILET